MAGMNDEGGAEMPKATDTQLGAPTPGGNWGGPPMSGQAPHPPPLQPFGAYQPAAADPVEVAKLKNLQTLRQVVVGLAIVLLVVSLLAPFTIAAYFRGALWVTAGVVAWLEGSQAERMGLPGNRARAFIYFAVALIPFLRGR